MKTKDKYKPINLSVGVFFVVLLSAVLGLVGCEREGAAEKAGKKIDQATEGATEKLEDVRENLDKKAKESAEYMDDATITAGIKAAILSDPLLKAFQINVTTTGGVVTLSGIVDSQQSIYRALEIAKSNQHVKKVENGLAVKGAQ